MGMSPQAFTDLNEHPRFAEAMLSGHILNHIRPSRWADLSPLGQNPTHIEEFEVDLPFSRTSTCRLVPIYLRVICASVFTSVKYKPVQSGPETGQFKSVTREDAS